MSSKKITNPRSFKLAKNPEFEVMKIKTETNTFGIIKLLFSGFVILLQVVFIVLMNMYLISLIGYYLLVSFILSIITSIYIISSNKNSISKATWIFFVLIFFWFAYIIYFMADERVFFGKSKKKYKAIFNEANKYEVPRVEEVGGSIDVQKNCEYLKEAGNFYAYKETNLKYYSSGAQLFDDILEELEKATKFVFIEFFIISDGILLNKVLEILEQKIKQGVEVRLIYDDMGSHRTLSRKVKKRMKNMGIKIAVFNPLISKFSVGVNYRDHRKIIDIDGKVAFTGGINLADEYVNEKRMYGYWKDAGLKIEGSAVNEFSIIFLRQWEFIKDEKLDFAEFLNQEEKIENSSVVVPYADGLDYTQNIAKNMYANLIANAKQKIHIMTPYFIIDDTIRDLLISKAQSGVDIKIILPDVADKRMVYQVSRSNAEKLIDYGIKIYVMKNSFVHSKVMITESGAIVGSVNFDLRSFYQQFEIAVYTNDVGVLKAIKSDISSTIRESKQITLKNRNYNKLRYRMLAGVLRIVSPFM